MSAGAGFDVPRLALALARVVVRVWPELDDEERADGAAAIDAFVAAPSPAQLVAATRILREARLRRRSAALTAQLGARTFARAVAKLDAVPFLDDELRATLTAQPADGPHGRRLSALADLLTAHAELAARLRAADAAMLGTMSLRPERRTS